MAHSGLQPQAKQNTPRIFGVVALRFLSEQTKNICSFRQPGSFSHSFEFILYIRVVRSPCGAFRGLRQNLEGDWTNQPSHLGGPIRLATASFATSNSSGFLAVRVGDVSPRGYQCCPVVSGRNSCQNQRRWSEKTFCPQRKAFGDVLCPYFKVNAP